MAGSDPARTALARELRAIVGQAAVLDEPAQLLTYESDGLAMHAARPQLVCLPGSTDEAARVMRKLAHHAVPVVGRGAGTGLSGGAVPLGESVVVGTARMRRVLELDIENRFARVEAGLVNVDLSRACASHGLLYAPDPSSQMACTIGGNVAENSGGPHCFKYGSTTRHVLGLVIVGHDGELLDLAGPALEPAGYDLVGLFVGSEGTFGLATEITVGLVPAPEQLETLLGIFPTLDAACESVSAIIAEKLEPSALEILDQLTIQAVEDSVFAAGYPRDAGAVLLIDVEGHAREVEQTSRAIRACLERSGALETRRATTAAERRQLWAGRKGAFGAMGRIAPDLYVADVVAPRTKLSEIVVRTAQICQRYGLKLANVFHAGDGNLHPNICYDRRDPDEVRRVIQAGDEIMRACIAAGGSLSGEHGIGIEKREAMEHLFGQADFAAMCRVRDVWDPDRRMNPGKILPTRACLETRGASLPRSAAEPADEREARP